MMWTGRAFSIVEQGKVIASWQSRELETNVSGAVGYTIR